MRVLTYYLPLRLPCFIFHKREHSLHKMLHQRTIHIQLTVLHKVVIEVRMELFRNSKSKAYALVFQLICKSKSRLS